MKKWNPQIGTITRYIQITELCDAAWLKKKKEEIFKEKNKTIQWRYGDHFLHLGQGGKTIHAFMLIEPSLI